MYDDELPLDELEEFVDEDYVPARSDGRRYRGDSEKLGGLEKKPIEIDDVALGGRATIAVVVLLVSGTERLAAGTPHGSLPKRVAKVDGIRPIEVGFGFEHVQRVGVVENGLPSSPRAPYRQHLLIQSSFSTLSRAAFHELT